ncbi:MAG: squalene/phytoene synthase family protein [Gammaproteobacteria bacterium]
MTPLDETYRTRAIPPGTSRYWSWLFAAAAVRPALLGIYALSAEWQALMDPATESAVAHLKLAWWQEEMQRLAMRSAVHPISSYLAALPGAAATDFTPLLTAAQAAAAHISGVPLERGADLEPQSDALWGGPLALVSRLSGGPQDDEGLCNCIRWLAAAGFLARGIRDYRREAHAGRVPFAIDELMTAGIDNADLAADPAPAHLLIYLQRLREQAAQYFHRAAQALPRDQRTAQRHLLVLAALGHSHLENRAPAPMRRRFNDMLLAWQTARRA